MPSPLGLAGEAGEKEELDAELLALPGPPRRARALTVAGLAAAGLVAAATAFALRRDVAYALVGASAVNVGDLRVAGAATLSAAENRFVRAEAMLGAAGAIRYQRPFAEDTFRAMPVAGRPGVWVEVRVPSGQENGRWQPPRSFSGRLVRFDAVGLQHRGLAAAIEETTEGPLPAEAWLLVDGDVPADARRSVALAAVLLAFAIWNGAAIARIVRKVR